jgi:hypothetical protein
VSAPLEVRSFRSVFALERRIYRIDTLRLNPAGVPLRGLVYASVLVAAALLAGAIAPTAWLDPLVPWYLRDIAGPLAGAALLGGLRVEGRTFHLAARALLTHRLTRRRLDALAPLPRRGTLWRPPPVLCIPDGSDARFRPLRYHGPGAVMVHHPHLRAEWSRRRGADITLHPINGPRAAHVVLELSAGAVLEVRKS